MNDEKRTTLAAALKRRFPHPALWAYIDAAETAIMNMRFRLRPETEVGNHNDYQRVYMREYRYRRRVQKLIAGGVPASGDRSKAAYKKVKAPES